MRVLVRDPGKAALLFGAAPAVEIVHTQLDDPAAVAAGLANSDTAFLAGRQWGRSSSSPSPQEVRKAAIAASVSAGAGSPAGCAGIPASSPSDS